MSEEVERLKERLKAVETELEYVKTRCVLKEEEPAVETSISYAPETETTTIEIPRGEEIEEAESATESEPSEEEPREGPTEEPES